MIASLLIDLDLYVRTVMTILMHSLWQGILIWLLMVIALALLRMSSAKLRYAVSCSAMAGVVIATVVTTVTVWPRASDMAQPISSSTELSAGEGESANMATSVSASSTDNRKPTSYRTQDYPLIYLCIFFIWVAGVVLLSAYHLVGWRRARRLVKHGTSAIPPRWHVRFERLRDDLRIKRLVSFLSSSLVKVPCVVGWMKPVVLIPVSMFSSLETAEIEMILMHELAHVRRYDILVNMIQTAMETLFFFHPAVWWISRQIRIEREDCCDDIVVLKAGDRFRYARALTDLEGLRMFQTSISSAINGTPLRHRIQRIVGVPRSPFYLAGSGLTGMLVIAALIVAVLGSFGISDNAALRASESDLSQQTFDTEPGDLRGEWETEPDGDQLRILVYGRKSTGMSYVLAPDEVAALMSSWQGSSQIVRDAGTLFLEGELKERGGKVNGSGRWYFRPDTAYMRYMRRYGLAEDDRQQVFSLAIRDISLEYLAGMEERGFRDLNVDQLVSAGVFGISPELVDEFRLLGYPHLTYQQLLAMQVQTVTPGEARRFNALGLGHLTPEQLISANIQGLTPGYVKSFRDAGFHDLTFENFGTLHAFNLDVDNFENCYRHRFMDLSENNMVWVCGFGITMEDVERMKAGGLTDMDEIIKTLAEEYGR